MTQYWIEVPVENAKEVVQRKIDELTNNFGVVVSYDQNCEVVLYQNEWDNWSINKNVIYFGSFFVNIDAALLTYINILLHNPFATPITIMDWDANSPDAGEYPCIIFNDLTNASRLLNRAYFIGYKFTLTYP